MLPVYITVHPLCTLLRYLVISLIYSLEPDSLQNLPTLSIDAADEPMPHPRSHPPFPLLPPPTQSECYKQGGSLETCKKTVPETNPTCESLRQGVFACRRGQLDNRTRIRGNKGY